jgi:hypothetical protein
MRSRTLRLIEWMLLASPSLMGAACGGSEGVRFKPVGSDAGSDVPTGAGGNAAGGTGGTDGSGGTAGNGGGSAGASGSNGGSGGAAGNGGAAGGAGIAGTAGSSGAAGTGGAIGSGGTAGVSGAAGTGAAGGAGASGVGGAAGNSGAGTGGSSGAAGGGLDAGLDGDANPPDVESDGDGAIDAGCPTVFGTYAVNNADGKCGDLDEDAPQEIRGAACALQFISVAEGGTGAINGSANLGADGTFSGATLVEGTATRSPCSGSWNEKEEEITVVCGTGTDECSVELRRSGP